MSFELNFATPSQAHRPVSHRPKAKATNAASVMTATTHQKRSFGVIRLNQFAPDESLPNSRRRKSS